MKVFNQRERGCDKFFEANNGYNKAMQAIGAKLGAKPICNLAK